MLALYSINCFLTNSHNDFSNAVLNNYSTVYTVYLVVFAFPNEYWTTINACFMQPSECFGDENFEVLSRRWHEDGGSLIGGCCRTTPSTIKAISKVWKSRSWPDWMLIIHFPCLIRQVMTMQAIFDVLKS